MSIGDAFKIDDIFACQLAEMCDECGLPQRQVALSLGKLCTSLLNVLPSLSLETVLVDRELSFARELIGRIEKNTRHFLELAEELPRVQL